MARKRKFVAVDYEAILDIALNIRECLPPTHLARVLVDIFTQLDLSGLYTKIGIRENMAYAPEVMLGLLFYSHVTEVYSPWKIEEATYESIPFFYIAGGMHPDSDAITEFRLRFQNEIRDLFVRILVLAQRAGISKLGNVSLEGARGQLDVSSLYEQVDGLLALGGQFTQVESSSQREEYPIASEAYQGNDEITLEDEDQVVPEAYRGNGWRVHKSYQATPEAYQEDGRTAPEDEDRETSEAYRGNGRRAYEERYRLTPDAYQGNGRAAPEEQDHGVFEAHHRNGRVMHEKAYEDNVTPAMEPIYTAFLTQQETVIPVSFSSISQPSPSPFVTAYGITCLATQRQVRLPDHGSVVLGRFDPSFSNSPDIDLAFEDGEIPSISRRHARISSQDGQHWIEDLGSTNGTYVNGYQLELGESVQLAPGDRILLGRCRVAYTPMSDLNSEMNASASLSPILIITHTDQRIELPCEGASIIGRSDPSIGYKPDVDLNVANGVAVRVSRRHAQIVAHNGQHFLEAIGSAGGLRLNGREIRFDDPPMPLHPGDQLWLGGCVVAYEWGTPAEEDATYGHTSAYHWRENGRQAKKSNGYQWPRSSVNVQLVQSLSS